MKHTLLTAVRHPVLYTTASAAQNNTAI